MSPVIELEPRLCGDSSKPELVGDGLSRDFLRR